jgi:lipid II:glycine glycyltransferase (peptidoglycan interpeptide bridge formation enzyme)
LPDYSFYQLPVWAQAYEETYPNYKIATKLFSFEDGTEVLVPLVRISSRFGFEIYQSLPGGGYGGLLWNRKPSERQVEQIVKHLLTRRALLLEIHPNPLDWEALKCLNDYGFQCKDVFTHILKLDKPEVLWDNFHPKCKQHIRRAQRENLKLVAGGPNDLESSYYKMYQESAERWGIQDKEMTPLLFLQNLIRIGGEKVRLFFVEREGERMAGVIVAYGKREGFQLYSSFHYQSSERHPNEFWQWELLKDAYERGYEIQNFGASVGLPGVQKFKESFGTKKIDYKDFIYASPLLKIREKMKPTFWSNRK